MKSLIELVLLFLISQQLTMGFVPPTIQTRPLLRSQVFELEAALGRRECLVKLVMESSVVGILSTFVVPSIPVANAAAGAEQQQQQYTVWNTGKAPIVPGQTIIKDKSDTKGTKRDPNFLRSISDCKAQCEQSNGPDGFARSKEECLELCQDICCKTYEQCTFAITPR